MKKTLIIGFLGASLTIALAMGLSDLFDAWELKTLDARFKIRGPIETDPNIILIDADDPSAQVYGRWPWKRSAHAEMIGFLSQENPSVIAYDILFAQPIDDGDDQLLIQATKINSNVIYPAAVSLEESNELVSNQGSSTFIPTNVLQETSNTKNYSSATSSIFPLPQLLMEAKGIGHIAANRDKDGVIRRVPLLVRYQGKLLPSLGFQAVINYLDIPPANIEITNFTIRLKQILLPGSSDTTDIDIPVDSHGQMLINYAGRWAETFKHASFASVLSENTKTSKAGEDLSGKLILVSNTISGQDIKSIPYEEDYPGAGVHANITNTILTRSFLRESSEVFNVFLIILLSLATATLMFSRKYLLQSALVVALLAGYTITNIFLFQSGVVLELLAPVCSIFFTTLLVSIHQASSEKGLSDALLKEKSQIESHLSSILQSLEKKETDLKEIQSQLYTMQEGIDHSREMGEKQAAEVDDLNKKLQSLLQDKDKLLAQRTELENKVLDLRVHISFEKPVVGDLQLLKQECEQYGIKTQNPKTMEVFRILKQAATAPSPVIILGESGTGKELFAKALHLLSGRAENFISVNMGAIPEGLVESDLFGHEKGSFTGAVTSTKGRFAQADQGTIFLDEIGEATKAIQVKLLRVLQEKEVHPVGGKPFKVNVRIVSATNKDLQKEVREGNFRDDLFYRLNTIPINLPPLRERKDDIELLAQHFIRKYCDEYGKDIQGISDRAMKKLMSYDWPGNIRELENVIQRGITLATGELIQENDLGLDNGKAITETAEQSKRWKRNEGDELLILALRNNGFEINQTAAELNMHRNTITARFKGICFDLLVKNQIDLGKAAREISGEELNHSTVHQMIAEYHNNLVKTVSEFGTFDEAIQAALKRNKNVPAQYHTAIKELVRCCYVNKESRE
jgi:transcriptional regulator with PAS, ATPase and Fis domain/CHASE2 domain-containing sensor protein